MQVSHTFFKHTLMSAKQRGEEARGEKQWKEKRENLKKAVQAQLTTTPFFHADTSLPPSPIPSVNSTLQSKMPSLSSCTFSCFIIAGLQLSSTGMSALSPLYPSSFPVQTLRTEGVLSDCDWEGIKIQYMDRPCTIRAPRRKKKGEY